MRSVLDLKRSSDQARRRQPDSSAQLRRDRGALPNLQHDAGNQAIQALVRANLLQAKLTDGSHDDPAEREAEEVATRIVGSPSFGKLTGLENPNRSLVTGHSLRQETSASPPGIVSQVLHSEGRPLDPATRAFFEPRLGRDLSHVRIHADSHASDSARSIHALAYAHGSDIVFAPGRYAPHSEEGKRLLAHELVHTVQQRSRGSSVVQRTPDLGGLTVSVAHTGTNVPISGVKVHIDQKLVSSSKSIDLVTDSSGNTPSIQVEEGDYTITADYKCCEQVQTVHVTGNVDQVTFFEFGRCDCGISSTDQSGDGAVANAGSNTSDGGIGTTDGGANAPA